MSLTTKCVTLALGTALLIWAVALIIIAIVEHGYTPNALNSTRTCTRLPYVSGAQCMPFVDGCVGSYEVSSTDMLNPSAQFCPITMKCCVSGVDVLVPPPMPPPPPISTTTLAPSINTTTLAPSMEETHHMGTANLEEGATNYFVVPPLWHVLAHSINAAEVHALLSRCPTVASIVPPGIAVILVQSTLATLFGIFCNAVSSWASRRFAFLEVLDEYLYVVRCTIMWKIGGKIRERLNCPSDDGLSIQSTRSEVDMQPLLQQRSPTQEIHDQSSPKNISSFMKSRRKYEKARVALWEKQQPDAAFVGDLFRLSPVLGFKCAIEVVVAFIAVIVSCVEQRNALQWDNWYTYNYLAAAVMNGACLKSAISVSSMLVFVVFEEIESMLDVRWWDAQSFSEMFHSTRKTFFIRVVMMVYVLTLLPCCLLCCPFYILIERKRIGSWQTTFSEVSLKLTGDVHDGKYANGRRWSMSLVIFAFIFAICVLPFCCTHFLPGLLVFLPWVFIAVSEFVFFTWAGVLILSCAAYWTRVSCGGEGDVDTLGAYGSNGEDPNRKSSALFRLFCTLRLMFVVLMTTVASTYAITLPVNYMILWYHSGLHSVGGEGYVMVPLRELSIRSSSCYYLQALDTEYTSIDALLRTF